MGASLSCRADATLGLLGGYGGRPGLASITPPRTHIDELELTHVAELSRQESKLIAEQLQLAQHVTVRELLRKLPEHVAPEVQALQAAQVAELMRERGELVRMGAQVFEVGQCPDLPRWVRLKSEAGDGAGNSADCVSNGQLALVEFGAWPWAASVNLGLALTCGGSTSRLL